jgi:hypothetical protein
LLEGGKSGPDLSQIRVQMELMDSRKDGLIQKVQEYKKKLSILE